MSRVKKPLPRLSLRVRPILLSQPWMAVATSGSDLAIWLQGEHFSAAPLRSPELLFLTAAIRKHVLLSSEVACTFHSWNPSSYLLIIGTLCPIYLFSPKCTCLDSHIYFHWKQSWVLKCKMIQKRKKNTFRMQNYYSLDISDLHFERYKCDRDGCNDSEPGGGVCWTHQHSDITAANANITQASRFNTWREFHQSPEQRYEV